MSNELNKKEYLSITFAQLSKLLFNEIEKSNVKSALLRRYSKEQITQFLQDPKKYQKELRILSNYLYNTNPNYRRLILYFAYLLRFDFVLEPHDLDIEKVEIDKFKKQYYQSIKLLEVMNIPHEMQKALKVVFKDDVFYGYEHSTKESYFIQRLNPDYCRISSIEDGVYNFEFDFSYFDKNGHDVRKYAEEFQQKYNLYKNDKNKQWQELDSKRTVCFKLNEEIEYPIPPFNTVFETVFDIDETKRMRNVKNKIDNYMLLTQQIPIDEKSGDPNKFLIDLDTAIAFHNKAIQSLPEEVGLVTSPMKIEAIKLERKNNYDNDIVAKAERDYYNATGVSQTIFNSDKANSVAINKSIITDEEIVFGVLRQIERWVNRKLKFNNTKYKFKVRFLNTTIFNHKEVSDKYLKAAQFGMPVKQELAASLGLSPSALINKTFLENEIMDLHNKLIPLSSSHTQSGKNDPGRPLKNDDKLSESGSSTRDNGGNIRK